MMGWISDRLHRRRYSRRISPERHEREMGLASGVAVHLMEFMGNVPSGGLHEVQLEMLAACHAHPLVNVEDTGTRLVNGDGAYFVLGIAVPEYVQERRHYGPDGQEREELRTEHLFPGVRGGLGWIASSSFPLNLLLESDDGAELEFVFFPEFLKDQETLDRLAGRGVGSLSANGNVITVREQGYVDNLRYIGMCPAHGLEIHTYCLNPFRSYEE